MFLNKNINANCDASESIIIISKTWTIVSNCGKCYAKFSRYSQNLSDSSTDQINMIDKRSEDIDSFRSIVQIQLYRLWMNFQLIQVRVNLMKYWDRYRMKMMKKIWNIKRQMTLMKFCQTNQMKKNKEKLFVKIVLMVILMKNQMKEYHSNKTYREYFSIRTRLMIIFLFTILMVWWKCNKCCVIFFKNERNQRKGVHNICCNFGKVNLTKLPKSDGIIKILLLRDNQNKKVI